jgi:hypothetical protein
MTLIATETKECSVCGNESEQKTVWSTHAFGSPDLDTRPPFDERSTIDAWVEYCPHCGYCNDEISSAPEGVSDLIKSFEYQTHLKKTHLPELAKIFICKVLFHEWTNDLLPAAWAAIHAAWASDDAHDHITARQCRLRAVGLIKRSKYSGKLILGDQPGGDIALAVDLLRRAGMLDEAKTLLKSVDSSEFDEIIRCLLTFQAELIEKGDVDSHHFSDAVPSDVIDRLNPAVELKEDDPSCSECGEKIHEETIICFSCGEPVCDNCVELVNTPVLNASHPVCISCASQEEYDPAEMARCLKCGESFFGDFPEVCPVCFSEESEYS